jgi:hypothetical protein
LVISNELQIIPVDLKAAHTESGMDVARPDGFNISLFDHVLCPLAGVHLKFSKGFGCSRVVLELVPLEMCFNQNLDKLSGVVVLDQIVGQFLCIHFDSAEPLASYGFWIVRVVGSRFSWRVLCSFVGSGLFARCSFHICNLVVSRGTV